ncbi:MAG: hypothetical protein PHH52_00815 [Patescibacteria group bacterium]|nr:hypothetical protein [Patescibacteria group bacterium]MDD3777909.1 hypothetical protein [Patescibacteria group bacterium]MDD3939386.1 hypothetical protein [Patescibacteria group bacterium]MDD4443748.1 hypothetical protein [Patescibacteria group bacterium]
MQKINNYYLFKVVIILLFVVSGGYSAIILVMLVAGYYYEFLIINFRKQGWFKLFIAITALLIGFIINYYLKANPFDKVDFFKTVSLSILIALIFFFCGLLVRINDQGNNKQN